MRKPSPATVLATAALFISLGGTTYAAANLPRNSVGPRQLRAGAVTKPKLHARAVDASKVALDSLTGAQIDESTLRRVPNAAHADQADHATDADRLGGAAAATYVDGCPGTLHRAPDTDLCFDFSPRPYATWLVAAKTCALARMRLPTPGELAEVFDDLGAVQSFHWTSSLYFHTGATPASTGFAAVMLAQTAARELQANSNLLTASLGELYRCVTTVRND